MYDLDTLNRGLQTIRDNIKSLKEAVEKEEAKEKEYLQHIAVAESILKLHGVEIDGDKKRCGG